MRLHLLLGILALGLAGGCGRHLLTDYRALDQAGMFYGKVQELKDLNTDDLEVAQLVKVKQAGISDDACVSLIRMAHDHKHTFASADAVVNLVRGGFSEPEILDMAQTDRIDTLSLDAVTLRLTGLSTSFVLHVLQRRAQGLPTLSGAAIGRLKNTGLTESQILQRINEGMTDEQAERESAARERARNQTGFVRRYRRRR
ncbi:MAG: hypothetical protein LAN84_11250 [Acidobacteriia bacterium]|nr:hypothetical protein [Terriglobia bacterium]